MTKPGMKPLRGSALSNYGNKIKLVKDEILLYIEKSPTREFRMDFSVETFVLIK